MHACDGRKPATGGESSCHLLATRLVLTVCWRTSSRQKLKATDSFDCWRYLIVKCHSGSPWSVAMIISITIVMIMIIMMIIIIIVTNLIFIIINISVSRPPPPA
jgi:hypothetical protein